MKTNHLLSILAIATTASILSLSCKQETPQPIEEKGASEPVKTAEEEVANGKYLVGIMGCNDCHSPKVMGPTGPELVPELLLSGYPQNRPIVNFDSELIQQGFAMFYPDLTAAAGPWGISFAANLTPDETGLGSWSEEQFKTALTKGKFKGLENSRMLLPPMPWMNYLELSDADIHDIFAYLKSIKPVSNIVPQPISPDNM